MFLNQIIERKREEVAALKNKVSAEELLVKAAALPAPLDFRKAVTNHHKVHLIAEIKKASPSAGVIRKDFDPVKIAQVYQAYGASAVSVLTDKEFFSGHLSYIKHVKAAIRLPVLRKDFIIDAHQIYESRAAGADAILLIAQLLSLEELTAFIDLGRELGMGCLVEVHSEEDMEKAVRADADIIGINNRNLHTFKVDIHITTRLAKLIPKGKTIVSESGIGTHENIIYLHTLGVNAVLIGEAFMRSDDIGAKVKELLG